MSEWFYRWLFTDFWVPVWPNIAAALLGVVTGFLLRNRIIKAVVPIFHRHYQNHLKRQDKA